MPKQVIIGCKLPCGVRVTIGEKQVHINGMNTALVAGGYGLTYLDEDDAAVFFATHSDFDPVKNQSIFTHHTDSIDDVIDMAEDLKDEKTGFEGLDPTKPAPGLKPEDKQATSDDGIAIRGAAKSVKSKADQAAAAQLAGKLAGKGKGK